MMNIFKKRTTVTILSAVAALIIIVILFGLWPVAFVNYRPISYGAFSESYGVAYRYYESNLKMQGKDTSIMNSEEIKNDIRRAALESLIINSVVDQELSRKMSSKELNDKVTQKISVLDTNSDDFKKGINILYGLTPDKFINTILIPKAKEEILAGNVVTGNKNFSDWMTEELSKAKVVILLPNFSWDKYHLKTD